MPGLPGGRDHLIEFIVLILTVFPWLDPPRSLIRLLRLAGDPSPLHSFAAVSMICLIFASFLVGTHDTALMQ